MNYYTKYVFVFLILMILGMFFERYKKSESVNEKITEYGIVKKYLLNDSSLAKSDKPILWIHCTFETNARDWESFGSRNTKCFNQPYQYLTIKSIVDKCGDSFNICLIDDKSFHKIIPGWSTRVANLPNPLRPHLRQLAMAKVLYNYGGMVLPSSFICMRNMIPLYNNGLSVATMFCGELPSKSSVNTYAEFFPTNKIMGCKKDSVIMNKYVNFLEKSMSDYTEEAEFTGEYDRFLYQEVLQKNVMLLDAKFFGGKDSNNQPVILDDLLDDNDDFTLTKCAHGLYIPQEELLKRSTMQWFVRSSPEQVLSSDTVLARYLLLSNN